MFPSSRVAETPGHQLLDSRSQWNLCRASAEPVSKRRNSGQRFDRHRSLRLLAASRRQGSVLAVTSHFLEFQDVANEKVFLAHELILGKTYRVIVTTGAVCTVLSGRLVRVTGFIQDAPCLRFIGREGAVSDLFGEKLQATFVEGVIRRALAQQGLNPRFFLFGSAHRGNGETRLCTFPGSRCKLECRPPPKKSGSRVGREFPLPTLSPSGTTFRGQNLSDQPGITVLGGGLPAGDVVARHQDRRHKDVRSRWPGRLGTALRGQFVS